MANFLHLSSWIVIMFMCMRNGTAKSIKDDDRQHLCSSDARYEDALSKGILFFEGQRSGKLPAAQRVEWRGDSALSDGSLENVSLSGGYYDAGDNVKFGWPMAFSVSLLSWAAAEYGHEIDSGRQLQHLRTAIRWGTDFLLQAHKSSTTLYTQVGDADGDHGCWERPEDMDTARTLYKITATSPGTEVAAEAAAALAAASIIFKEADSNYSAQLLRHSESLFEFADKYRGSYQGSCPFYCSYSGFKDELLWAAAWLYKASGDSNYLNYVSTNQDWSKPASEFSWDSKFAGAQTLLAKEFLAGKTDLLRYKNDADSFVCALMPGSSSVQIRTTPGGLLYTRDSSNLQYVTSASMVLLVYSKILTAARVEGVRCGSVNFSTTKIAAFARSQLNKTLFRLNLLGPSNRHSSSDTAHFDYHSRLYSWNNPMNMSYMVGFGAKFPTQLHHRGSSLPSIHTSPGEIGCKDAYSTWYTSPKPNPNTHVGAIVGGPDSNDHFTDSRSDFLHLEPTTYMNAAFVGSMAALLARTKQECLHLHANRPSVVDY
ncbi:UNVERIFIED_CONTAM: Endoglucanase [Sesamum radiatum]|uniref:Endoglucanase n=1 Tax=Sesamum radiatum TaxID=300843 RepID=A0AAW2KZY1_SESRA